MSERDDGPGQREVAYRIFAAEFDDADFSYSESDEERAPNYVITPTGARINRLFVVGVLTEVEKVGEDVLRARVVDPTGAFVLYAGQYQPDEQAFLDRTEPPAFVAVTGKARTFQPEDSDRVFTSIRPESISLVDAETRDRWTVQTAEQTLQRIEHAATALSVDLRGDALTETLREHGVSEGLAAGVPLALDHYGTSPGYLAALRETALDAARLVSGDVDEVAELSLAPNEEGPADLDALADASVEAVAEPTSDSPVDDGETAPSAAESADEAEAPPTQSASTGEAETQLSESSDAASEPEPVSSETSAESETSSAPTPESEPATATAGAEAETATESAPDPSAPEPSENESAEAESAGADAPDADDDIGDFDPGEFELDEDEREEIESEYGTEFQSGTEVDEPGEADIDTPDPDDLADREADAEGAGDGSETEPATETSEPAAAEESEPETETPEPAEPTPESAGADTAEAKTELDDTAESGSAEAESAEDEPTEVTPDEEPAEDVDIEDAVVEVMEELDSGDGADRSAVVDTVAERYGVSPEDVEEAIQDALMSGRCYEPDDDTLKSI